MTEQLSLQQQPVSQPDHLAPSERQPPATAPAGRPAYFLQSWLATGALVVLAVVALVWTVELVRIQQDVHDTSIVVQSQAKTLAAALKTAFSQFGAGG
ncbi:hypothetical protein [uncultured Friedmanniella sp.]|uniref:hypothetical protein n=1 Tax=uncultured Friedmanniella sp. TaxID=335381 RepID=UPI0035CAF2DC